MAVARTLAQSYALRADAMGLEQDWPGAMRELTMALNLWPEEDLFDRIRLWRDQLRLAEIMGI